MFSSFAKQFMPSFATTSETSKGAGTINVERKEDGIGILARFSMAITSQQQHWICQEYVAIMMSAMTMSIAFIMVSIS